MDNKAKWKAFTMNNKMNTTSQADAHNGACVHGM
jgi:hypothetical protein